MDKLKDIIVSQAEEIAELRGQLAEMTLWWKDRAREVERLDKRLAELECGAAGCNPQNG